ncbi:uncharacterized protein LOC134291324 [Aedes albopictus]|uniref:Uncharacterized protein n=1 Tax=Aedes albopictus TaxID=7160 RepID=A0ABM1Y9B2_AEDAL
MEGHHEQLGYTCRSCNRQDPSESNLISCDQCRQWEHFNCAGVSDTLQSRPFICKQCQDKDVVGSTISTRLRSKTKRVPSGKESGSKPASNVGSKVSSVGSSNRSSVMKARLKLIEEEEQIKQKELDEEEAMKELEHDEAQRQLEQRKKQIEEQAKLMEQESPLRQRKLEADKARLMKQQLIRRESLEKKKEILLQISERGSVVESSASSLEKVSDWLAKNLPHGTTGGKASENRNDRQTELISTAPEEVSPMTIKEPGIKASVSIPPERLRRDQKTTLHFSQVPPAGMTVVDFDPGSTNRFRFHGVQSTTVREPFQRFLVSAKPSQPYSAAVYPNSSQNQQTFIPCHDERFSEQPTHCQQKPSMRGVIPSLQTVPQISFCEPHPGYRHPSGIPDRHSTLINQEDGVRISQGGSSSQGETPGILNPQQIAARQVVGKDLPHFSGNPTDWPMFISSFEQSTVTCGYSNAENLVRLQRCLTGHARESVSSRLLLPANVPHVISTLRMLYGRPELLIRSLHEKIRRTPGPRHDRPESILEFGLAVQNFVDHLQAAQQEEHLSNPMLMQELIEKLPGPMRMDWAAFKSLQSRATVSTFGDFMTRLVKAASEVSFELPGLSKRGDPDAQQRSREKARIQAHAAEDATPFPTSSAVQTSRPPKKCRMCNNEGHRVAECARFKQLNVEDRWKQVEDKGLCRTCLNNHGKWPCKSWKACEFEGCRLKHHSLLHSSSAPVTSTHSVNVSANELPANNSQSLFRILPVVLYAHGKCITVFAFIDEGSQVTMLEEKVAKELGVSGPKKPLTLQWTGNVKRDELRSEEVSMQISGKQNETRYELRQVRTVSRLLLPAQRLSYKEMASRFPHLKGLPIADYDLVQPKLLIGLDNLGLGVPLKIREGRSSDPIAAKCRLGWSIYGRLSTKPVPEAIVNFHTPTASSSDYLLNEQLRDFFTLDNNGVNASYETLESEENKRARRLLEKTTRRMDDRFETGLLWKSDDPEFPETYPMAIRRMKSLEKKLMGNPPLAERVSEQILDFERKGYIRKLTKPETDGIDSRKTWFLPLGVVINAKKPGKIRLIWDAAATVQGVSFNSFLLKGPDLLTALPRVLSGFRLFPVAVTGDIREMFLQIKLQEDDRNAQMFIYRHKPGDPIQVYAIGVTMFGSTSAAIKEHHYVDDYLDSFKSVDEAVQVVNDVKFVHSKGGFEIRNFLSNEGEVLRRTGEIEPDSSKEFALTRGEAAESVLGMKWIPSDDVFTYTFAIREDLRMILKDSYVPTKREVLKVIMSLFDPLGLVAFFLVHGKILMQDVWASGIDWDQKINDQVFIRWRQWISYFPQLDTMQIPRCYFSSPFPKNFDRLEIHILVDASDSAYACVAYYRLETENGIQMAFICAKTKVAPLKVLSIPRLELKAAILGVRMLESIRGYHTYAINRRVLWSDSSTVLAWIKSEHRRYNKFVAVRIGEILTTTDIEEWRWVPSGMNTADLATKWKSAPDFSSDSPWLSGPSFLLQPETLWPQQTQITTTCEELRLNHTHSTILPLIDVSRFSNWTRLQRTMAFVLRFSDNLRRKRNGSILRLGILCQDELQRAEMVLWKIAQAEAYPEEIVILSATQGLPTQRHQIVSKSSPIYKNWPYIDEHGVLRQRGESVQQPLHRPKLNWFHRRFRHANREIIVNEMRQRFEIAKLRALIEKVAKSCMLCRVRKALPSPPVMAPLPAARLQPFTSVGVDYFGPILVRVGRSSVKRWIALFTCLSVRAVHLEVVHSLSTESCVMAVRRFIARRGYPAEFYSDNGTCFQGASKELQREEIKRRNDALAHTFTTTKTRWCFIPPAAPHMGGAWERLVRSVKVAIESIANVPRKPDDEILETIFLEAEALINSRPLTYIPLESADQEAITPNHFLLGSSNGDKFLPYETVDSPMALRNSWRLAQSITQVFWARWVKEYLPVITRRSKWFKETRDIAVGDLVLVVAGMARDQWIRGRVEEVIPGRDGRVRQAVVRTATGSIRRPAVKLAVLDVKSSDPKPEVLERQERN